MQYTKLGNTEIEISKLCVGCMSFGKAGTMHDWTLNETESEKVIAHALELGINFFDTANGYSAGTSEEYLGRALKKNIARDKVVMGKYDRMEQQDIQIVRRVKELSEKYSCRMSQIAIAWQWARGVASPIIGATKVQYLDDAAGAFNIHLSSEDILYLEELYVPHEIVGAINANPPEGVVLLDEKK